MHYKIRNTETGEESPLMATDCQACAGPTVVEETRRLLRDAEDELDAVTERVRFLRLCLAQAIDEERMHG